MCFLIAGAPVFGVASDVVVSVNDCVVASYSYEQLCSLSYPIPQMKEAVVVRSPVGYPHDNVRLFGITLDELFPVMVDAWELIVTDADGTTICIKDEQLAEKLSLYVFGTYVGDKENQSDATHTGLGADSSLTSDTRQVSIALKGDVSTEKSLRVWLSWEGVPELKREIQRYAGMHGLSIDLLDVPKTSSKLLQTHRGGGNGSRCRHVAIRRYPWTCHRGYSAALGLYGP